MNMLTRRCLTTMVSTDGSTSVYHVYEVRPLKRGESIEADLNRKDSTHVGTFAHKPGEQMPTYVQIAKRFSSLEYMPWPSHK